MMWGYYVPPIALAWALYKPDVRYVYPINDLPKKY